MAWFDDHDLRVRAGKNSYARGLDYLDAIRELRESPDDVVAMVQGTKAYQVRLSAHGGELVGNCSCPWGQQGNFCKHCVAVGLSLLAGAPPERPQPASQPRTSDTLELRAYLSAVGPVELVDLLLELAGNDPALHRRLSLRAAAEAPNPAELRPIVAALRRDGCLDDVELASYVRMADEALHTLDMLASDHPAPLRPLYQQALQHLTETNVDDDLPGDPPAMIRKVATRAVEGFVATCRAAPPDPAELARWLIGFQVNGPGWPHVAITDFVEPLGDEGLATYWHHLAYLRETHPSAADDEDDDAGYDDYDDEKELRRRQRITRLREEYLTVTGNVDALVALYTADLPNPERYVQIAQTLRAAGRVDEAITWLRRGLSGTTWERSRIRDLLAELYTQAGRHDKALQTRWQAFTRQPGEYSYRMLCQAAKPVDAVAEFTDRALTYLREKAARGGDEAGDPLVTVLRVTGKLDQAWAATRRFHCSEKCLYILALHGGKTHHAEAISAYLREIEAAIDRKDRHGYDRAATLLTTLKDLHQRAGSDSDFTAYLDHVKDVHRQNRALMRKLASARL